MIEAKGPGSDGLLGFPPGVESVEEKWLKQSSREVSAAGARQVVWYFAEQGVADHAKRLFEREGGGREKINIRLQRAENP